jgi:hypothetical protein
VSAAPEPRRDQPETPPPIFRSWRTLYLLLLAELAALVMLFSALTRWAS